MTSMPSELSWARSIGRAVALVILSIALASCGGSGGGGSSPAPAPPAGSVIITGTVSGTVIKVLRADTNAVISQTDTAPLVNPPFPFTLTNIPVGVPLKIFFFSAGDTFPLYFGNTNVFYVLITGSIDLGFVLMGGDRATPANQPSATMIQLGTADPLPPPQNVVPLPATLTVPIPPAGQGSVIVNFAISNFSIGGEGQQHLHIHVGNGPTRHFFNGSSNKVVDNSGNLTTDVQWQSANSFRLNGLSVGLHQVTVNLATAADSVFVNEDANPLPITVTINSPPAPPATLNITNPSQGASMPSGPVEVSFAVQNFTIGGQGTPHLHIYVDEGVANHLFNAPTNEVRDGNGQPVANITRQSNSSFQVAGLSSGPHTIRLVLANDADQELQNAEANPPMLNIEIQAPPGTSTVTVTSGTSFLSSPVTVTFSVTDFTIGLPGTPHLRFSIDGGPLNDFYNGGGINSDNGVLLNGVHTHSVHWTSTNSFSLFGLAAGAHQVSLVLVDAGNNPLPNAEASTTHNFIVQQPPSGDLQLQPVLSGLDFPIGLAQATDGRVFYAERLTGIVRIINSNWSLGSNPFCQLSVQAGDEAGLLGLTLDPNFSSNGSVYAYYTVPGGGSNRISRLNNQGNGCTETTILDNVPSGFIHNGGILQFGPDGMLYAIVGDAANDLNAPDLDSLAGKILRMNPDGTAPLDNPFYVGTGGYRDYVFSFGHRNSYGFTFHPQTGDLWESENGPDDNDEVNRVIAGRNYGWPFFDGFEGSGNPGYTDPIVAFNPVIAPTGILAVPVESSIYPPAYHGSLLVATWNDGTIRLVIPNGMDPDLPGSTSVAYTGGQGGLLSLMLGSDGYIYVSNSSGIFRVVPH